MQQGQVGGPRALVPVARRLDSWGQRWGPVGHPATRLTTGMASPAVQGGGAGRGTQGSGRQRAACRLPAHTLAEVLGRTCDRIPGERSHVLCVPPPVRLHPAGGLPAASPGAIRARGPALLLGLYTGAGGDPAGQWRPRPRPGPPLLAWCGRGHLRGRSQGGGQWTLWPSTRASSPMRTHTC